jgi:hypothetical protein
MAVSGTTELAGLMERIQADAEARFRTDSTLWEAVDYVVASGGSAVQFPKIAVPTVVSAAATEGTTITPTATSISAISATLGQWVRNVDVSNLAIESGQDIATQVSRKLSGDLAGTVDTEICKLFEDFAASGNDSSSALSADDFWDIVGQLEATKFTGRKVAVFHPRSWVKVGADISALANYVQGQEFVSKGYVGEVAGCEIWVSPWVQTATDGSGNTYAINGVYFTHAIGFGFHEPLIRVDVQNNIQTAGKLFGGESQFAVSMVQDAAGFGLLDKLS